MTDARSEFRKVADEASPAIAEFWVEAVKGAEKKHVHEIRCKCGLRHREEFSVPDIVARTKAAEMLLQYGWGRPGTAEPERDLSGSLSRPAEELSADERAAILAAAKARLTEEVVGDGEAVE